MASVAVLSECMYLITNLMEAVVCKHKKRE